jgi:putative ABC transport system permease protein
MFQSLPQIPRLALQNLGRHRVRNLLVGLGVGLSAGLLFLVLSVGEGIRDQLVKSVVESESGAVNVRFGGAFLRSPETAQAAEMQRITSALSSDSRVSGIRRRVAMRAFLVANDRTADVQLKGIEPAREGAVREAMQMQAGTFVPASEGETGIVIGETVAQRLGLKAGDACVLMGQTRDGGVNAVDCRIAGVFRGASRFMSGSAFAPYALVAGLYNVTSPTELLVDVRALPQAPAVYAKAAAALKLPADGPVHLATYRSRTGLASSIANVNSVSMMVIVLCLLVIAAVGISTAVVNNVNERTPELGTLLALGFSRGQVARLILLETAFLSLLATLCGLAVFGGLAFAFARNGVDVGESASLAFGMRILRPQPTLHAAGMAFWLGLALPVVFTILPARRGSRMNPVDALRAAV